ncbi:MAG: tetratricopeptide repeat protein [Acidobacteriota bacterium]
MASLLLLVTAACRQERAGSSDVTGVASTLAPTHVGRQACAACHPKEAALHAGSHHDLALQQPTETTVLGDFDGATLERSSGTTTFLRQDDHHVVRTEGPDGELQDYRVAHLFGAVPLQQCLLSLGDGRLQAFTGCWDDRPESAGGQRWFDLHDGEPVAHDDVLHWTGPAQNWNHQCAECHSTNLVKDFDDTTGHFETTWSEEDVSCEACHGPGSAHVAWAEAGADTSRADRGLTVRFAARGAATWGFVGDDPIARKLNDVDRSQELDTCGRCHSRRSALVSPADPSAPLADTHRLSLLDEGLYHADGQVLDEVFVLGSFLQSRMHAEGVTCTDCHDPHSGELRAEGDATCAQCHRPDVYFTREHHHHEPGTEGASCLSCHAPVSTFMVIDGRRDHSFPVPRPDLSVELGTPNACNDCHADQSSQWAADRVVEWHGPTRERGADWARAIAAGRKRSAGAGRLLAELVRDHEQPAIVRSTALGLLQAFPSSTAHELTRAGLSDASDLVRRTAVGALGGWEASTRVAVGWSLLDDPRRAVRTEAVGVMAPVAGLVPPGQRATFDAALAEYRQLQAMNADRADAWVSLGNVEAALGDAVKARAHYEKAIDLQPSFVPASVNLADLLRALGRDEEGEVVLRRLLALVPDSAEAHHALGLTLVRLGQKHEAVSELGRAAQLGSDPRLTWVHALALVDLGRRDEAVLRLEAAAQRWTGDRSLLSSLVQLTEEAGDREAAARWRERLAATTQE